MPYCTRPGFLLVRVELFSFSFRNVCLSDVGANKVEENVPMCVRVVKFSYNKGSDINITLEDQRMMEFMIANYQIRKIIERARQSRSTLSR